MDYAKQLKPLLAMLLLLPFNCHANTTINHCPDLEQIKRTPGEFSWTTSEKGWQGAFIDPQTGKGNSHIAEHFVAARWIQFSNLPDSAGYVQCDYSGDLGNEVIRFTQIGTKATKRPDDINWTHVDNINFPSVQRECTVDLKLCEFEPL